MEFLTVQEVAKELKIPDHVVRAGIRNGAFPFGTATPGEEHTTYTIPKASFEAWKKNMHKEKHRR